MNLLRPIFILALSLALSARVEAHAFLDHADPKVGSTVSAPAQVTVFMTEELEAAFCTLQVWNAAGTEVDKKNIDVSGATMTVSLPALRAGTYKVIWKAVATDTHKTSGTFTFTVQ